MIEHNIPLSSSSFVGRGSEIARIRELVAARRLVTLVGPGGTGKSRLAAEALLRLVEEDGDAGFDEVRWVGLDTVTYDDRVALACAGALGLRLEPEADVLAALAEQCRSRRLLLCFDTCEHVVDAVADLVSHLLRSGATVSVLATSREPLGVEGEAVFRVPALRHSEAVALFADRAALVDAGLSQAGDARDIRAICSRLDCLPLGLELAAARTRVMSPRQLLAGLDDRFHLLTGGARRAVPRHQTLRSSLAWSHDLLRSSEQILFRWLAVFTGPFTVEAVDAVCTADELTDEAVLPTLAGLVDKSMVTTIPGPGGEMRYRLLDSVRQYAAEQLVAAGEAVQTRDRHLAWCVTEAERIEQGLTVDQDRWREQAQALGAHAESALAWGLQRGPAQQQLASRLARAMTMPWFLTGQIRLGFTALQQVEDRSAPSSPERTRIAGCRALLEMVSGRRSATTALAATEELAASDVEDEVLRARLLLVESFHSFFGDFERCERVGRRAAEVAAQAGDLFAHDFATVMAAYSLVARDRLQDAVALVTPALERSRERSDRFSQGFALGLEQWAALQSGDIPGAIATGRAMVDVIVPLGEYFGHGTLTANLALALVVHGDIDEARRLMRPIVATVETAPDVDVVGFQVPMGVACLRAGDAEQALQWFSRALRRLDDAAADWTAARSLPGAVAALRQLDRRDEAADLLATGCRLADHFDSPLMAADVADQEGLLVRDDDPARAYDLHQRALGLRHAAGLRTFIPDTLEALVGLAADAEPDPAPVRLLAASDAARAAMGAPRARSAQDPYDATVRRLRAALGREYDAAWEEGLRLSLDEAVALARRGRGARGRPRTGWASLSPAELEVVRRVVDGKANTTIASELFISRSTVKTHLSHVFAKLGVSNRTELATYAAGRLTGPPTD